MADELHIFLLGPLVVQRSGRVLPDSAWRSRQERRLLLILLGPGMLSIYHALSSVNAGQ